LILSIQMMGLNQALLLLLASVADQAQGVGLDAEDKVVASRVGGSSLADGR
jgi:hypothetical protein